MLPSIAPLLPRFPKTADGGRRQSSLSPDLSCDYYLDPICTRPRAAFSPRSIRPHRRGEVANSKTTLFCSIPFDTPLDPPAPSAIIRHHSLTSAALPQVLMSGQRDPHCLSLGTSSAPDSPITPASDHALFPASSTSRYTPSSSLLMALFSIFRRQQRDVDGDATELLPTPDVIHAGHSAGRHQRQPSGSTSYSMPESTLAPGDEGFDFETSLRNVVDK